ncbi:SHOCT domain-containing protein [Novosphingobium naphthalenivorans]|uniref:SHOCT domain-containing protein n=1 Tax=Novosphingobium naphthalenivorans TaxID=273168 RepID=UPI00083029AD|nr:SHOCT domain-containing protein [Novosphingobium naphthalenivorans]
MMNWGYGMFGGFGMLLFWGVVIVLAVLLLRQVTRGGTRSRARQILEERYAKGEISKEEFDERRKDLSE